jgi:hypothetical protein
MLSPSIVKAACKAWENGCPKIVGVLYVGDMASEDDIIRHVMPSLCNMGFFKDGDDYEVVKKGDAIVISNSGGQIDPIIYRKVH